MERQFKELKKMHYWDYLIPRIQGSSEYIQTVMSVLLPHFEHVIEWNYSNLT